MYAIRSYYEIRAFLERTPDAELLPLHEQDTPEQPGWQILPGEQGMDGFFYAKLKKRIAVWKSLLLAQDR